MKYIKKFFEKDLYWRSHIKDVSSWIGASDKVVGTTNRYRGGKLIDITYLVGKVIDDIQINNEETEVAFFLSNGELMVLHHEQDCCEQFWLEDFDGEPYEICNCKIMSAEERISHEEEVRQVDDSATWTFYVIRSLRGTVTLRFCGTSNGYYSERCDIIVYKLN